MWLLILYWTYFGHATYLSIYIFDACGCTFYGFMCEYFYDDVKCNNQMMYCYTCVCVLYMIMHDVMVVCFLYVIMNVLIQNVVSHLIYYTIEFSGNMCECNGFKCSNHLFSAQEFSKEVGITYPVVVVKLGDKQLGV